jgi:aminopeptidase N
MKNIIAAFAVLLAFAGLGYAEAPVSPSDRVVLPAEVVPERYDIKVRPNAQALTFAGEVEIAISVQEATDRIVLNGADLTIGSASLSGRPEPPKLVLDDTQQTATFVFEKPVEPGRYVLSIDYTGKIYQQAFGLFALDYDTPQGQHRALFTKFENSDARRFVPSWDEPGRKAVFALTVIVPQDEMAISNMPIVETTEVSGQQVAIRFAASPKMSSYLLFLALGDFERVSQKVGDTEVGVVVRRGETAKAKFALDAAVRLLGYYNDYFDTPYPLPKLDLVAAPGQSQRFGAMENWGAIFYFDYLLLLDPQLSTDRDKQDIFVTVAHEMAHQWFGDLVTMAWWDDLWLNEGFASWMENKTTDHFHPEWKIWLQAAASQQKAMDLDARSGTHPVVTPIHDVFQAAGAFDMITYQKGMAVVRMLEAYVGEDAFRAGVRTYIKKHAYSNAVTDDLWAEIDKASPLPVSEIAHDFTLQAGVPLILAEKASGGAKLSQQRFAVDDTSQIAQTWHTPVRVESAGGGAAWRGVVSAAAPATVTGPAADAAIVNVGQTGYFRVAYDPALWAPLAERFARLAPDDQLGLLNDSLALGEAGQTPMSAFLDLADRADAGADQIVLGTLADQLASIDFYYEGLPGRSAYRAFARDRLNPVLARLGWDVHPGEADNEALLRATILTKLGGFDDAAVIAEARRRFAAYLVNPDTLSGSTRQTVLNIVASNADPTTWEQIHSLAKAANSPTDKSRLYALLGASHDLVLADKALALALSDEPPATVGPVIIKSVSKVFPGHALDFALANRVAIEGMVGPNMRWRFFAQLAQSARDVATAEKLAAYAEAYVPVTARGDVTKAIASIRYSAKIISDRLPHVDSWITAHRN